MALYFLCLVWVVSFYCVFIDEWVSSYATFYRRTQSSISVKRSDVMQFAGMAGNCPYYLISLCWKKKKNKTNPPKKYIFKYKKVWTLHSYMRVIITREISPFNGNPRSSFPTLFLAQFSCVKVEEGIRSIPRNKESKEKRKKKKQKKKLSQKRASGIVLDAYRIKCCIVPSFIVLFPRLVPYRRVCEESDFFFRRQDCNFGLSCNSHRRRRRT